MGMALPLAVILYTIYKHRSILAECWALTEYAHVDKRTIGGVDGAIARGSIENRQVTVIILPVGTNDAVTTVIMASPERANWVNNFIDSLKKS